MFLYKQTALYVLEHWRFNSSLDSKARCCHSIPCLHGMMSQSVHTLCRACVCSEGCSDAVNCTTAKWCQKHSWLGSGKNVSERGVEVGKGSQRITSIPLSLLLHWEYNVSSCPTSTLDLKETLSSLSCFRQDIYHSNRKVTMTSCYLSLWWESWESKT